MSGWGEFGVVVGASLTAMGVGGIARWSWQRLREPHLVIECGNSPEFKITLAITSREHEIAEGEEIAAAQAELLILREKRGRIAREVTVTVDQVTPLPPDCTLPYTLDWLDGDGGKSGTVGPHNNGRIILQEMILTHAGRAIVKPAIFSGFGNRVVEMPGDTVFFSVSVRISGERRVLTKDFRMVNPWPSPFGVVPFAGPLPKPLPSPSVYEN